MCRRGDYIRIQRLGWLACAGSSVLAFGGLCASRKEEAVTATYHEGYEHGLEMGRVRALKDLAALQSDPDSVEVLSQRLFVSEQIVDWVVEYFTHYRKQVAEGKKPYGFNGHIEWHAREQQKMREPK